MKTIHIISAASLLLLTSCAAKATADNSPASEKTKVADTSMALVLPVVPDSLTSIPERAAYATLHYWDSLNFESGLASCDTTFIEKNFANFVALLSMASVDDADAAIEKVIDRASKGNRRAFDLFCFVAAKYLDEPDSPMRNEELYIPFLRYIVKSPALSPEDKIRPSYRLDQALKNRPGLMATDFAFDLRGGGSSTLRSEGTKANATLLIFYDPDCEHCKEIISAISSTPLRPGIKVLAIDFIGDRKNWQQTAGNMPKDWMVGFATSDIEGDGLYHIPASPSIYLIDSENLIILKDPDYRAALDLIAAK